MMFQGTGGWYAKVALISGALGATMELFMIKTGFYEKVIDLEAQRRADELHAAKEEIDAARIRQQPNLSNQPTSEQTKKSSFELKICPIPEVLPWEKFV